MDRRCSPRMKFHRQRPAAIEATCVRIQRTLETIERLQEGEKHAQLKIEAENWLTQLRTTFVPVNISINRTYKGDKELKIGQLPFLPEENDALKRAQKMLDTLENLIQIDTPFRLEERRGRVDLVRSSLAKPKVTASEQVRQVLEAYNIEAEYGRKIDTYEDKLADGTVVNILVIGRIGMFYQTKDERSSGRWNNESGEWEELSSSYRKPIRDGIRMAKKLIPTDMLLMPVVKGEA
mgnify:CR=1 FL=1